MDENTERMPISALQNTRMAIERLNAMASLIERPAADGDDNLEVDADVAAQHAADIRLLVAMLDAAPPVGGIAAASDDSPSFIEGSPGDPKPIAALAHSLRCMADRAEEAGLSGNASIARRAAGFIANAGKSVTRLLAEGLEVRHAPFGDVPLVIAAVHVREDGRIMCTVKSGGRWYVPADELEPVYSIEAISLQSVQEIAIRDPEQPEAAPTVHHLSVDPDQEITLHGPWAGWRGNVAFAPPLEDYMEEIDASRPRQPPTSKIDRRSVAPDEWPIERHNCADDEFPS